MKNLVLAVALLFFSQLAEAFSYTLEITQEDLQLKISAMMPMEKKKFFITVVLSEPKVDLSVGNNEIGVFSHVEVIVPGGIKGTGTATITGSLSYDPDKSEFFYKDPNVVSLNVDGLPPKYLPNAKKIAQLAASKYLSARPIYKLKDENLKLKLVKAVLQSVKVENDLLLVELSAF